MKRITMILSCLVALCLVADANAQGRRRARREQVSMSDVAQNTVMLSQPSQSTDRATTVAESQADAAASKDLKGVDDALAEVNEYRARRGLRAFLPDPLLNKAAQNCARIRAANLISGHLASDFAHLPPGGNATAAGCGALEDSWGWGTCCTKDNYTYAGAAWYRGADGRRYMHLFVR